MMTRLWRGQIRAAFAEMDRLRPRGAGKRESLLGLLGYIAKYEVDGRHRAWAAFLLGLERLPMFDIEAAP